MRRLRALEELGHALGFMKGPRSRGRKPERMNEAYPELQMVFRELLKKQILGCYRFRGHPPKRITLPQTLQD